MTTTMPPPPTLAEILSAPELFPVWAGLLFVWGLLIGSFLNVAIYRTPLGMSVNRPRRSFCFRCGTTIRWYDNIPIVSYLLLRGRCRACGARFSPRYAMVELLTGLLFAGVFAAHNHPGTSGYQPVATVWYLVFVSCLIVGTFTDLDHWIIPARIPRAGAIGALTAAPFIGLFNPNSILGSGGPFPALRVENGDWFDRLVAVLAAGGAPAPAEILWWEPLVNALIGAVFATLVLMAIRVAGQVIFRKEAMGFGDVELFMMIGATVGAMNSLIVLVLASFFGSLGGMTGIVMGYFTRREASPLLEGEARAALTEHEVPVLTEEERERTRQFAEGLEMEFADLTRLELSRAAVAGFPRELALTEHVLPLGVAGDAIRVALADPQNTRLVTVLREALGGRPMEFVIAAPSQLAHCCQRLFSEEAGSAHDVPPLWRRYFDVASKAPLPRRLHHLPFIPWIALGAVTLVLFYGPICAFLRQLFFPYGGQY